MVRCRPWPLPNTGFGFIDHEAVDLAITEPDLAEVPLFVFVRIKYSSCVRDTSRTGTAVRFRNPVTETPRAPPSLW